MHTLGSAGGASGRAASLAAMHFAAGAAAVSVVSVFLVHMTAVGPGFAVFSLGTFTGLALLMAAVAPRLALPGPVFGAANQVTLARAVLVSLIAGLLAPGAPGGYLAAWAVVAFAGAALLLDGVDGWLARRFARASSFGARFDMETDALLALVLSLLVFRFDKAGAWIIAAGGARYAFVVAGTVMPQLRGTLPPRWRRQAVCVFLIAALTVCLVPAVKAPISEVLAAVTLIAVGWSFAVDVVWLWRQAKHGDDDEAIELVGRGGRRLGPSDSLGMGGA